MKFKRLFVHAHTAVFITIIWAFAIAGCQSDQKSENIVEHLPETTPVIVQPAARLSETRIISVSGALVADKTTPTSFMVSGKVEKVMADEGDRIQKGALLATIESQDFRSRLDMAKAAVLRAKDAYERYEPLYREGAYAEKNFIELKASLVEATAARDIAAKALKDTKLYAPISGIIGAKAVEVGQMVSPQAPVFTIIKTDRIYARVAVPEAEIDQVTMGKKALVTVSALGNHTFTGRVSMIGALADERTRTYAVKIELENPDLILRTGMMVSADIHTDKAVDILAIPGVSIVRDPDNLTYAFVADTHTGVAHRKRIFTGKAVQDKIEIRRGILPDDIVIISGQNKLTDGAPITIMQSSTKEATAAKGVSPQH